jgi:hypothetical protein
MRYATTEEAMKRNAEQKEDGKILAIDRGPFVSTRAGNP